MTKLNEQAMTKLITLRGKEDRDLEGMEPVFLKTQAGGLTRLDAYQGRDYLVAPTVAVISKVLNGELLPAQEVALFTEAWNGRPIPLRHPQVNGLYVSANSPRVMEEFNLGYFFNARAEEHELGVKLVGEMWLDVALVEAKGGPALTALKTLEAGGTVEVSTGYFCLVRPEEGEFNGEKYSGVQYNIKPDHVALLPDQIGACSVEDGCGVNTNALEGQEGHEGGQVDTDTPVTVNALPEGQAAMVGVFLTPDAAAALAVDDSPAPAFQAVKDLHVTLAYLGEGGQVTMDQQTASELVDWASRQLYAHTVQISGAFRFYNADQGQDAVGYLVNGETLEEARRNIVQELQWAGQNVSRPSNWVPHITLGYTSEGGFTPPSPGVDRFAVQAITLAYGDEVVHFPLRGELGQTYQTMGENNMAQNDEKLTPCAGQEPSVNSDGGDQVENPPTEPTEDTQAAPVVPEDLQAFMDEVKAAGGVQAIMDALGTVQANTQARRNGAIERIKAHSQAFSDDVLNGMTTDALEQTADALGAASSTVQATATNYAASRSNANQDTPRGEFLEGVGDVRPFSFD